MAPSRLAVVGPAILAIAAALLALPAAASADVYRVTLSGDPAPDGCRPGDCSLREAVLRANRHPGRDLVLLRSGTRYELGIPGTGEDAGRTGDLDLTGEIAVGARGSRRATVDANRLDGAFDGGCEHCRFQGLRIVGGDSPDRAGAIANGSDGQGGTIAVVDSALVANRGELAGGIATSNGPLAVRRSTVRANRGGTGGIRSSHAYVLDSKVIGNEGTVGGIRAVLRSLEVRGSRIAGNRGTDVGGILAAALQTTISRSAIDRNAGGRWAGGLLAGNARILDSAVRGNRGAEPTAAGGILVGFGAGGLAIARTTISGNRGGAAGGIRHAGPFPHGDLGIRASTLARNHSESEGGAIAAAGSMPFVGGDGRIANSTLAGNTADGSGGAIALLGDSGQLGSWLLRSVTIAGNRADADGAGGGSGGGVFVGGPLSDSAIANTLFGLNSVGATGSDPQCSGELPSAGGNLRSSDDPGCVGFERRSDLVRPRPGLAPLGDHGGPTATIALRRRSPAIGRARPKTSPPTDQRGVRRDRRPDIGAFERRGPE